MGDLSSGKKERFQLLLQQLQLTEDVIVTHFQNAEIDRVVIEKQARKWHFFFQFERIVPCQLYNTFRGKLEQTSHISRKYHTRQEYLNRQSVTRKSLITGNLASKK